MVKIGAKRIELDQKFVIQQPNNEVDEEGQNAVLVYLRNIIADNAPTAADFYRMHVKDLPPNFNWNWLVEREGSLPKRISKYYFREFGIKLTEHQLAYIGTLASDHCPRGTFLVDFTLTFDWRDGDFKDKGSCFWNEDGSRKGALQILAHNKVMAMRFYDPKHPERGKGRAWVAKTKFGFAVFNGYGYTTAVIARILADWSGLTYRRIKLFNNGDADGTLYINHYKTNDASDGAYDGHDGFAFALGKWEAIHDLEEFDLKYYDRCCASCYDGMSRATAVNIRGSDDLYCSECAPRFKKRCPDCRRIWHRFFMYGVTSGKQVCPECREKHYFYCDACGKWNSKNELSYQHVVEGKDYCDTCYSRLQITRRTSTTATSFTIGSSSTTVNFPRPRSPWGEVNAPVQQPLPEPPLQEEPEFTWTWDTTHADFFPQNPDSDYALVEGVNRVLEWNDVISEWTYWDSGELFVWPPV